MMKLDFRPPAAVRPLTLLDISFKSFKRYKGFKGKGVRHSASRL
jgi:hypothetical protein